MAAIRPTRYLSELVDVSIATPASGDVLTWSVANSRWEAVAGTTIPVPVLNGGTGATTASGARTNLGLGSLAVVNSVSLTSQVTGILPVASGGTGTATPGLVAGSNIAISGTWPNQTIAATAVPTSPGGSTGQIQYNSAGSFAGSSGLTYSNSRLLVMRSAGGESYDSIPTAITEIVMRNDLTGTVGYTFTCGSRLTVTHLGRWYSSTNSQDHQVGIWDYAAGTLIQSGTVLAASASDANGFKYVSVSSVTLQPDRVYAIGSLETSGGDNWKHLFDSSNIFDPRIRRLGPAYTTGGTLAVPWQTGPGTSIYGSPCFKFTSDGNSGAIETGINTSTFLASSVRTTGDALLWLSKPDQTVGIINKVSIGKGVASSSAYALSVGGAVEISTGDATLLSLAGSAGNAFAINQGAGAPAIGFRISGGYLVANATSGLLLGHDAPTTSRVGIGGMVPPSNRQVAILASATTVSPLGLRTIASQTAPMVHMTARSSTTDDVSSGAIDSGFVDASHASRTGFVDLYAPDFNSGTFPNNWRRGLRVQANGSTADVVIPIANVRDAADDAAAAALSPAVPVGGLYRTGSLLKIRVS